MSWCIVASIICVLHNGKPEVIDVKEDVLFYDHRPTIQEWRVTKPSVRWSQELTPPKTIVIPCENNGEESVPSS